MIIIALPQRDFDPTEVVVPWQVLRDARHAVRFATTDRWERSATECWWPRGRGRLTRRTRCYAGGAEWQPRQGSGDPGRLEGLGYGSRTTLACSAMPE